MADLDILRILTLVALGMAVSKVLYNLVRVYISVTPLTFIGKESLDVAPTVYGPGRKKVIITYFWAEIYCFLVADLDILRILTLVALGMAVSKVLYNLVRVYISVTPLTFIGKESLDVAPLSLFIIKFMESNHSVLSPNQKCVMFFRDKNASSISALIAGIWKEKKKKKNQSYLGNHFWYFSSNW